MLISGLKGLKTHSDVNSHSTPRAPLTNFNDGGGVRRIFLGLWKTPGFSWVAKTTQGFFWVLYFSSAQIKNNISAIYSFVFDQNQIWSWHVLAFQKISNKICWCKNTEGFFWVDKFWSWDFLGYKNEPLSSYPPPIIKICEWGPWAFHLPDKSFVHINVNFLSLVSKFFQLEWLTMFSDMNKAKI